MMFGPPRYEIDLPRESCVRPPELDPALRSEDRYPPHPLDGADHEETEQVEAQESAESEVDVEEVEEIDVDAEGVVWTLGVQSTVLDADGSEVGHVLLLDADGEDVLDCYSLAETLDGVTAILESSPGSYHLWHLSVRDFEEQVLDALSLRVADPAHVASSYRRGYSVLRLVGKVREDGSTYKDRPDLLDVVVSDSEVAQSRPHAEALLSLASEQDHEEAHTLLTSALDGAESESLSWIGSAEDLFTDQYGTLTDSAKEDVRE